jgi:hypothetical protein
VLGSFFGSGPLLYFATDVIEKSNITIGEFHFGEFHAALFGFSFFAFGGTDIVFFGVR